MATDPSHGIDRSLFYSAIAKFNRGKEVAEFLANTVIPEVKNNNPPEFIIEKSEGFTTVKLRGSYVPNVVPIIFGEALHNLKGALDHIISSIHFHITKERNKYVHFPFHENKIQHEKTKESNQLYKVYPELWDFIFKNVKPYFDEDGNKALWCLSKLNQIDKHRIILTAFQRSISTYDIVSSHLTARDCLLILEPDPKLS